MLRKLVQAKKDGQPFPSGNLDEFEAFLASDGIRGGLTYLNTLVPHRFTALYRRRSTIMFCTSAFDIEGEISGVDFQTVPIGDSYCQFVLKDGIFITQDARTERVLDGHKYQESLLSYVGMPVKLPDGEIYGTLCHFDFPERSIRDEQSAFFQQASERIGHHVPRSV